MTVIILFGVSKKKSHKRYCVCRSLLELSNYIGEQSEGIGTDLAIQSLLSHRDIVFFSVKKEGLSIQDYETGIKMIEEHAFPSFQAIAIPGVTNPSLLESFMTLSQKYHTQLLHNEADLDQFLRDSPDN